MFYSSDMQLISNAEDHTSDSLIIPFVAHPKKRLIIDSESVASYHQFSPRLLG